MYLVDTNVISEMRKKQPSASVVSWFQNVREEDVYLHVIVIGEIQRGIMKAARNGDTLHAAELRTWLTELLSVHRDRILPLTRIDAEIWGEITVDRQHLVDRMLAATAFNHGFTFVTRNVKHVQDVARVKLLNPFNPFNRFV